MCVDFNYTTSTVSFAYPWRRKRGRAERHSVRWFTGAARRKEPDEDDFVLLEPTLMFEHELRLAMD